MTKVGRPVMRFFGGKWRDGPWVIGHFPPHRVYVEPFGGAASILLRKPRSWMEVYNDMSDETWNVFRVLRDRDMAEKLRVACELTLHSKTEMDLTFEPCPGDPVEQARRTIARTFLCMASNASEGGRHGHSPTLRLSPQRNVGMEWRKWPESVPLFVHRLRGVTVHKMDALKLIPKMDSPGTLFYVDPPYVTSTRSGNSASNQRKHYTCEMDDNGHRALAGVLHSVKGMVVLSGYSSGLYEELYGKWATTEKTVYVGRSRKGIRKEVLWRNPAAIRSMAQPSFFDTGS